MKGAYVDSLTRANHGTLTGTQAESLRKKAAYLQNALKQQIEKRKQFENKLQQYRQRSLRTEKQFSRLLSKYDPNIALLNGQTYSQQIWNKLINEIQNFNSNSQRILEKRCDEIYNIMNRKVNQILQKTDYQIKKNKKLSEDQYHSIKQQIKEALNMAKQIEEESTITKRQNKDLIFKVNLLREEKKLLLQELNQKKLLIVKIKQQYIDPIQTELSSPRHGSTKYTFRQLSKGPKFVGEPSLKRSTVSIDNPECRRNSVQSDKLLDRSTVMMKTDNHFKVCLNRQKRKNTQLKGIIGKLQAKNKQIGTLVDKAIKSRAKGYAQNQREQQLERLIEDIKLNLVVASPTLKKQIGIDHEELSDILKL